MPAEPALIKLAKENGIEGNGLEDLVHNEQLNGIVLREMQQAGKDGGLSGIEIIDGVVLADEEWTAANVSPFFSWTYCHSLTCPLGSYDGSSKDQPKSHPGKVPKRSRQGLRKDWLTKLGFLMDNALMFGRPRETISNGPVFNWIRSCASHFLSVRAWSNHVQVTLSLVAVMNSISFSWALNSLHWW